MKNILFRADSSSIIGTGHIMRDLVLASKYKDSNIIFATQDLDGNINNKILETKYQLEILKTHDIEEVIKLIKKYSISMIVIDHYDIDYNYEKKLKFETGIKILSLDDTYELHYCDILLNHNISANKNKYKTLVPENCELRCGAKYTLLRDEFKTIRKTRKTIETRKIKVFLGLGGTDPLNLISKIIKVLILKNNLFLNIVTTTANPNIIKLKKLAYINKKRVKLYINCNNMAKVISQNDLSIVTPSVIVNEVMSLNVPIIAIKIAENQNDMYMYLKRKRFKVLCKNEIHKLKGLI